MVRRALVALSLVLGVGTARADQNDVSIGRLATPVPGNTGTTYVGQNLEFRELASQLGVVFAPDLLTPADTLGYSGFQLTLDASTTSIDKDASYWRARDGGTSGSMNTVGFFLRKGLWFPLPSFEIGVGAVHLVDSTAWTGQLYAKFALHEGYAGLPIPSVAVRGAVARLMNQRELDLTVASFDITLSHRIGIGGTWHLDPFAGYDLLLIIPRSEVIDPTPNVAGDSTNDFVFKDQATITRNRIFVGAKAQLSIVQLTAQFTYAMKGSSVDDRPGTSDACMPNSATTSCDAKDDAKAQTTISLSAGIDF
ncbi:MAG TPA: hypothetical protein VGM88_32485 [Kofleriaceae bacterium]|jgi:hypothetical protein